MSVDPKLGTLKNRIQKAEKALKAPAPPKETSKGLATRFFHVGAELMAGVLVGAGLGVLTDKMFDTAPWGLIIFFILGSFAGVLNLYKVLTRPSHRHNNPPHA